MESTGCIEDCALVREAQGGDHAAFEQLIRIHDQTVLRLALRITGSPIEAQDVYQETFLRAFRKLRSFRCECTFSTWIYRIATNVCLDHLRKRHNRKETSGTRVDVDGEEHDLSNQVSDDRATSNPEQQLLRRELGAQIALALTRLTPRERIIFELKHYQGLRLRTVSEILSSSEGSIKSGLFRGTQKLRLYLAGFCQETVLR
jgi:RNA polymerase sigma-70 factor, ECF subfamily